jgi:hypothetical protein
LKNPKENASHKLTFGSDEAAATVAACRESLIDIARGSIGPGGEYHPNYDDDPAVAPLARIAVHAATDCHRGLPVTELDMHFLKLSLKRFSDPERTKRAINESSLQFGTLNNGEIEQRVTLGRVASRLLVNLDAEFATADMEEVRTRFLSIAGATREPSASAT